MENLTQFLNLHRAPDEGGSSSGGGEVAPAQSSDSSAAGGDTAAIAVSDSNTDSAPAGSLGSSDQTVATAEVTLGKEYFRGLSEKMSKGYFPTDEENSQLDEWLRGGASKPIKSKGKAQAQSNADGLPLNPEAQSEATDAKKPSSVADSVKALNLPDDLSMALSVAMEQVGAKDLQELGEKTKELRNAIGKAGSEKGQQAQRMQTALTTIVAQVKSALSGDDAAKQKLMKSLKISSADTQTQPTRNPQQNPQGNAQSGDYYTDEEIANALDPDMMRSFNAKLQARDSRSSAELKELRELATKSAKEFEQVRQFQQRERAEVQVLDELGSLAQKYPEIYRPHTQTKQALLDFKSSGRVDPSIKPLLDVAAHMVKNGLKTLEQAHRDLNYEKLLSGQAEAVASAKRSQTEKLQKIPTAKGLTGVTQTSGTPNYTEADISAMVSGKAETPKEWFKPNGAYDLAKIPAAVKKFLGL